MWDLFGGVRPAGAADATGGVDPADEVRRIGEELHLTDAGRDQRGQSLDCRSQLSHLMSGRGRNRTESGGDVLTNEDKAHLPTVPGGSR